ncbi:prephenate dehydratase [Goodfellowiella coeruleoviolacea]|uniref:Prephenate dehydratase n=1 Tax=Goodfellowiella coeruleoviolacea TaxID=334858 RepID=A0AAE3KDR4_9PSEU|nr:prephenate dehydratase [Goodfellowiella coeruleoviolacea]MCP2164376.1 prephenate dehydratase [Goodfellowiella coeruleoviolacea]
MSRIAYFGPRGTFTEQAAHALATGQDELIPAQTVPLALDMLRDGQVDAACVPVENSVEGAVPATMDALADGPALVAVAEAVLVVSFSILTRPEITGAGEVRTLASHPHALAQVRHWVAANLPAAEVVATTSTAAAAAAVHRGEFDAAVSAPVAVRHYPLRELATDVADVPDARTRFLLLRRPGTLPEPTGADRTSVIATTPDQTGALAELLTELATRGINLTRLEARPTKGRLGEYRFYLDFEGHVAQPRVGDALAALHRRCTHVRFLGSYPKAGQPAPGPAGAAGGPATDLVPPHSTLDSAFVSAADWVAAVRRGERA